VEAKRCCREDSLPHPACRSPVIRSEGSAEYDTLADESFFVEGQPKTNVYRICKGVAYLYRRISGRPTLIEFAFRGDLIGTGFLETHVWSAKAAIDCRVIRYSLGEMSELVKESSRAFERHTQAVEQEFRILRDQITISPDGEPNNVVISFLLRLAKANKLHARDPLLLDVEIPSLSYYLRITPDEAKNALRALSEQGIISYDMRKIVIRDLERLKHD
jgi:CRP-like cAMP-binding protein